MLLVSAVLLFLTTLIFEVGEACVVRIPWDDYKQNEWDYMKFKRQTDNTCECGKFDPNNWNSPWNLYVHVTDYKLLKTCVGTIVASNLLVTSHKCLLLHGNRMRAYDMLKVDVRQSWGKNIAGVEEILITDTKSPHGSSIKFKPVEVIYHPRFAMSSEFYEYSEDDMVILKVAENLFQHPKRFIPICVPIPEVERIGNISGFYYGHTIEDTDYFLSYETNIPFRHFGHIYEKQTCINQLNIHNKPEMEELSYQETLCFRFAMTEKHTRMQGGPLIYSSKSIRDPNFDTAFLLGTATLITDRADASGYEASTGQDVAFFPSIQYLAKFIEFYAERHQSVWCKTPPFKMEKFPVTNHDSSGHERMIHKWPWEDLERPVVRDESLNCVCGMPRSSFRIAGGEEVPALEYGWMVVLIIYGSGRKKGANLCGGTIINNRVIMSAAHCVVNDDKIRDGARDVWVDPANIDATINAHRRLGDPGGIRVDIAAVLFHPNYVHAKDVNSLGGARGQYFETDVALLILKDSLKFPADGPGILPVCLPKPGQNMPIIGKMATAAGWGKLDPNKHHTSSPTLQHVEVPIQTLNYCRKESFKIITDNFICAGTLNRFKDAAGGDSGGPLMIKDEKSGQWYEVGIVSFGDDIDSYTKTVALYSDVQKLLPFVDFHSKRVGAKWCKYSK